MEGKHETEINLYFVFGKKTLWGLLQTVEWSLKNLLSLLCSKNVEKHRIQVPFYINGVNNSVNFKPKISIFGQR